MMSNALKAAREEWPVTYWAGLWLSDMYRQLAWKVIQTQSESRRNCHAPSWSWLSIDGPVEWDWTHHFDPYEHHEYDKAMAIIASPETQDVDCRPGFRELSADLKIWCSLHGVQFAAPLAATTPAAQEDRQCPNLILTGQTGRNFISVKLDSQDIDTENLYFLPLMVNYRAQSCEFLTVSGIIVQTADHQLGMYRRCGVASLSPYEPKHKRRMRARHGKWPNVCSSEVAGCARLAFRLFQKSPRSVEFSYQKYDAELGFLIQLV